MMCRKALVALACFLIAGAWAQQAAAEGELHGERLAGFSEELAAVEKLLADL